MKLVLSFTNNVEWSKFAVSWQGLQPLDSVPSYLPANDAILTQSVNADQLISLVQNSNIEQLLVFYSQAEYAIASQLQTNLNVESAAQQWLEQMTLLTGLQRKQRQKIKLVNFHQALQLPKRLNLQLVTLHLPPVPEYEQQFPASLELLVSCQLVRQQSELQRLNTLLQASALSLEENDQLQLNLVQVLTQHGAQQQSLKQLASEKEKLYQQQNELSEQLRVSTLENELLLQQLFIVQQEQEEKFLQARAIDIQLQQTQSQLRQENEKLKHEKQQLVDENKAKIEQTIQEHIRRHTLDVKTLQKKERELKQSKQECAQLQTENAGLQNQLNQTENELLTLKNSLVWKGVAPLRKLADILQRKNPQQEQLQRDISLLFTSAYFDADWYLKTYPDVAKAGINPAEHYLRHGAAEGRLPSPAFDGNWYLQRYVDVAGANLNPLLHFIKFGQSEGRQISPKLLSNSKESKSETHKA